MGTYLQKEKRTRKRERSLVTAANKKKKRKGVLGCINYSPFQDSCDTWNESILFPHSRTPICRVRGEKKRKRKKFNGVSILLNKRFAGCAAINQKVFIWCTKSVLNCKGP